MLFDFSEYFSYPLTVNEIHLNGRQIALQAAEISVTNKAIQEVLLQFENERMLSSFAFVPCMVCWPSGPVTFPSASSTLRSALSRPDDIPPY
jgi:hypothetical protein